MAVGLITVVENGRRELRDALRKGLDFFDPPLDLNVHFTKENGYLQVRLDRPGDEIDTGERYARVANFLGCELSVKAVDDKLSQEVLIRGVAKLAVA